MADLARLLQHCQRIRISRANRQTLLANLYEGGMIGIYLSCVHNVGFVDASKIVQALIDIATLLYYPRDRLVNEMEEVANGTA